MHLHKLEAWGMVVGLMFSELLVAAVAAFVVILSPPTKHQHYRFQSNNQQTPTSFLPLATSRTRKGAISSITGSMEAASVEAAIIKKKPSPSWFPTRIQDTLDGSYEDTVPRLFLRHIVVETQEMAQVAMDHYYDQQLLHSESDTPSASWSLEEADPFGRVAMMLSIERSTAPQGGSLGWIEAPSRNESGFDGASLEASSSAFPSHLVRQLFARRPKMGDVHVLHDERRDQWHVVQVAEVWLQPNWSQAALYANSNLTGTTERNQVVESAAVVGQFAGQNRIFPRQKKLRGLGVLPQFPSNLQSYAIQTAGCQMNAADSERLSGVLQNDLGLQWVDAVSSPSSTRDFPDVVILNTCSIRDHAEQKVYNALGPYAAAKRKGRQLVLVVTGCVAQQEGERLLKRIPEIDAVLGPQYIPFFKNVLEMVSYGQQVVATSPMMIQEADANIPPVRGHDVRAWVNVIYGCNEHCTYCVVPATRGTEQSRSMEAVLAECLALAKTGYKEITLIGQNIDAYGRDMVPKRTFADLLVFLNARLPNPMRIRYVTSHPRYFGQRVIDAVATLEKVCECFHMPFQAGDDEVLKRMRRGYTYESYLKIIQRIRHAAPDASITTDIIVGFPGETDQAFEKTLQLMEEVKFDNVNSFTYSPRPNTEAALWPSQIPEDVKADRLQRVQTLAAQHAMERSLRYVGRVEEVLVEGGNPRNPQQVMGRTRQGRQVYFDGSLAEHYGTFVHVRITEARTWSLVGQLTQ